MFKKSKVCTGVLVALGGVMALGALPVFAQSGSTVQITGSRIFRADLIGSTPVVSIGLETMGNMGMENFADMATQLPQFAPAFAASRTQSTFSGVASSGLNLVNLRNLGSGRSLVLINGRRAAGGTSTSTAVDFNNIPVANIETIEIITGGASAVYGSDAVAGVVNIITKKNFEGVEVGLGYGETNQGDNKNPTAHIMVGGKFGDRGRGLLTMQFDKQGQVSCKDRYVCAEDFFWGSPATQLRGPNAYSGVGLGGRFFVGGANYTRRNGSFTDANGALIPFAVAIDGYNRNADRDIAIPTKRVVAAAEAEWAITKGIKAFGEFNYGETSIDSKFEGHPFQSQAAGSLYGTLQATIPMSNPYIPAALRTAINTHNALPANAAAQITEITWWQRFNDAGGARGAQSDRRMMRAVAGVKGELPSLGGVGRDWRWELSHVVGRTTVNLNTEGLVNTANLYNGLRVEADPANAGQFRCVDAAARSQGCVPINPFADYNAAMQKALRIGSMAIGTSSMNDTIATLAGTLADLPAGSLRTVIGAEQRTFSGYLDRDVVVNNALATGNQISDTDFAKATTKEVFAEVLVPLLADKPGARALNFEGAVRRSSTEKSSYNTWSFGGDWEPIKDLRIRAKQAKSVRAPLPGELSGIGLTAGVINDPCTAARRNASTIRAANCLADGVPANYAPPVVVEQSVSGQSGGNANLNPEEGTTLTYGLVWTPSAVKGFSLTVDRFQIDIEGIITTVGRQIAVDKCYDTAERLFCGSKTRGTNPVLPGATWVLKTVDEQLQNVATMNIAGVDVDAKYGFKLPQGYGQMDLGAMFTVYDKATLLPIAGSAPINLLGQAGGSTSDQGYVKFTANANIGWRWNKFKTNWNMRHIGAADMAVNSTQNGFPKVGAHTYHNIRVGYEVRKDSEIFAGITNLLDKKPPIFASGTSGTQALDTVPGYYDPFGRSWFVGARMKF
ncbi:MAG: TonB-dependent receptor [Rubrivivax sp.]|nr:TonB-dependent receptor [Rubrivivax sp.]